jgi:hypothetical protein
MSDISPRRRLLGRLLLAGGAIAVPLTASVSYAAAEAQPLEQVELPPSVAAPPAPPPPSAPPAAPEPPEAPAFVHGDGEVRVMRAARAQEHAEGQGHSPEVRHLQRHREPLSEEQRAHLEEMGKEMEQLRIEMAGKSDEMRAHALALAGTHRKMPEIVERCDSDEPVSHTTLPDGRKRIVICQRAIERQARNSMRHALGGLRQARGTIAHNTEMNASVRAKVLAELDTEIARIEAEH